VTRTNDNQSFGWDYSNNRTTSVRNGVDAAPSYDPASNRILGFGGRSFQYTGSGQIYIDGARGYGYDAFDRLSSVTVNGATVATYGSNALDQRAIKTTAAGTTTYVYDTAGHLLEESGPPSGLTDYVWFGDTFLGLVRGGQFYAAHNDQLGRTEVLSNQIGNPSWRAVNAAFDSSVAVDRIGGFNLRFPGQYSDSESGLYYNLNRYYDPTIGRYTQPDPLGLSAGINDYVYAQGIRHPILIRSDFGV